MIEGGTFRSQNFVDLVPGHYPPEQTVDGSASELASEQVPSPSPPVMPTVTDSIKVHPSTDEKLMGNEPTPVETPVETKELEKKDSDASETGDYGPVRARTRVHMKSGPAALFRPKPMLQEDFVDLMKEVVPRLITEQVLQSSPPNWDPNADTNMASG